MEFKKLIGLKINYIRKSNKLSQEEFVEKLNIDINRGQLSRYESGENSPSVEFIAVVCTTFKISPYWLLDIDDIKLSNDEYELILKFKGLPTEAKCSIKLLIDLLIDKH
ncbi:helix-turn-helix domain-containing protein [Clostridium omnivorum]|uniref:HTH cro/C1-type domain-containing protein n=1 Tax=Clostridium omnivorum TaxID=1604902 RepID=A0ABQ5NC99_9CLOT|nr:helix-turn-helix transcriptional regulator [Clostridium sp. E14]GLC32883.1 hypothetical protein bsdE14_42930 [Clostridium sp. E14]